MKMTVENAMKEFVTHGGSEYIFDTIDDNQDLMRMLAVTMTLAQEVSDSLYQKEYPDFVKQGVGRIIEILPDAFMLDGIMFRFQMINKLLTAIAIERLEHEKNVIGAAKVA